MTFYIDVLLLSIRTIVTLFRESQPISDLTFEDLMHFARPEGKSIRTRA